LTKQVLQPLLSSLARDGFPSTKGEWGEFWLRGNKESGVTNAARVTQAIEALGPTFVKFGQALSARPDIVPRELADALTVLQDNMQTFDTETARETIRSELQNKASTTALDAILTSLSEYPIAAASIGQVYKATLPGYGAVAIKVQRPGIHKTVEQDALLLKSVAAWLESLPAGVPGSNRPLVAAKLVDAVDEFMTRLFEELDYGNEANNMETFAKLYSVRKGTSTSIRVIVPEIIQSLCTEHVLVMEWIDGSKLTDTENGRGKAENLRLIETGIECTLSQLLDTGILHADPHSGNLIKVRTEEGMRLGYLDFGVLSTVPEQVRDGLVCAVVELVFARNVQAVADLFAEMQLLAPSVMANPLEKAALAAALNQIFSDVLQFPSDEAIAEGVSPVPQLRFDVLLTSLFSLVTRFEFTLPPYFLNNARALATLEGIARGLDPSFNVLRVVYPYALNRLLRNPSTSAVVEETTLNLMHRPGTRIFDLQRMKKLLQDSAFLTGYSRRKVLVDVLSCRGGQRVFGKVLLQILSNPSILLSERAVDNGFRRPRWLRRRLRKERNVVFKSGGNLRL
jgi:predicted unusual protein kinase regulating ubiquinone biosynthesis (AarF/ABC1/UbiB family)